MITALLLLTSLALAQEPAAAAPVPPAPVPQAPVPQAPAAQPPAAQAPAAQTPAAQAQPTAPAAPSGDTPVPPVPTGSGDEAPADTEQVDPEPATDPVIFEAPVWTASPEADRIVDNVPMLGPWPDDWRPELTGQEGLHLIDPVLGDVTDHGKPLQVGPDHGPEAPNDLLGAMTLESPVVEGPPQAGPLDSEGVETETVAAAPSPTAPAGVAVHPPQPSPTGTVSLLPGAPEFIRQSLAEDFLPPPPRSGARRAATFFLFALLALLFSLGTERLQDRVRSTGLLPRLLSALTGLGRGAIIPLVLFGALSMLPRSMGLAVPFALVALAAALGWSTRDLLGDVFSGIVLTVERRIRPGDRLEVGPHRGVVHSLGVRTARVTVDDGALVSIPNRELLTETLRVDPDSYAPVVVPVQVQPHLSVGAVRQLLSELSLLSPYMAPSRPPNVYRDADRPDLWIVEARLVHPRYANAFRGSLVELADEELNQRKPER